MLAPVECTERPFFHIHTPSQGTGANRVRFGNWYETLANALEAPCGKYHENNLSVITFNYDRSLEYYLTETRSRRYKISFADAWKEVGALTIAHIHGHLGPLVGDGARPYGRYPTADEIKKCAEGIHIVHEAGDEHPVNQAHSLLTLSERVIFIGFGYDDRNLKKLKWANLGSVNLQSSIVPTIGVKARASKLAEGSWCGMTPNSRLSVESQFGIALPAYGDNVANEFIHHLQPLQNSKDQLSQVMAQKR